MKNLKELKRLIERYNSITIEEIDAAYDWFPEWDNVREKLTGFGYKRTCTLCVAVDEDCDYCAIVQLGGGWFCFEHETYEAIDQAETSADLLKAYRDRAEYLTELIKKYEKSKGINGSNRSL